MDSTERKRIEDEKAEYIRELDRFEQFGVNLTFKPTQEMDLDKLRHEYDRHVANDTLVKRVTVMKIVIQFGAIALEMLATKMKILKLEGWSSYMNIEMDSGKHDAMLEQVYRKIWQRGAPNPWISLAALILGSAAGFHFQFISLESARAAAAARAGGGGGGGGGGVADGAVDASAAPSPGPMGTGLSAMFGGLLGGLGGGGGGGMLNMLGSMVNGRRPVRGTPAAPAPASPPQTPQAPLTPQRANYRPPPPSPPQGSAPVAPVAPVVQNVPRRRRMAGPD
jgi:hypothetical protein